ncbi:MAG TPA: protein kinase [Gemmatimonadaceae bacterium]|nr:protein kinase [Gemmatimonadaceae bacterium]
MTDHLRDTLDKTLGGTYSFERELTAGGMSRLFLAEEKNLGRKVVVKVLSEQMSGAMKRERFQREIQVSARLQHPHIVPLLSSGEVDGLPYFVMPFIEGESLKEHLAKKGELPIEDAVRLLTQVASALAYAHKNGVVHRDIKPDNILLSEDIAVVTDFGIAKAVSAAKTQPGGMALTSDGSTLGTPAYMAPEQVVADPSIDHRADIYSFGVVAYEMLTNTPLFVARGQQALMAAHAVKIPDPIQGRRPAVPAQLARLVMQCLEKQRADRPQTAQEIMRKLATWDESGDLLPTVSNPAITPVTPSVTAPALPPAPAQRKWLIPLIIAIVVLAAAGAFYFYSMQHRAKDLNSVAVLPFKNLSGNKADEYFSDGMRDELANALTRLAGVRLASRTSTYSFKNRDMLVAQIGKELNVDAIVEGSVTRQGGRVIVDASLVNVADDKTIWNQRYERAATDLFAIQEEVASAIVENLKPALMGDTAVTSIAQKSRGTENMQAYDLYLQGKFLLNKRGADNLRQSITIFNQAISKDSGFARAYAALATSSALLPEYTDSPPSDVTDRGRAAALRALQIDPNLSEANAALGLMNVHSWNFEEAGNRYRAAISQDPDNATAQQWYGEYLFHTGRVDSAVIRLTMAQQLDPFAPIIPTALGHALDMKRDYNKSIAVLKDGISRYPDIGISHTELGKAYLFAGRNDLAVKELEKANQLDPELAIRKGELGYVYGKVGRRDDALKILRSLEERTSRENVSAVAVAYIYLGLGDYEKAISALQIAVQVHDIALVTSLNPIADPAFDPIRKDPRFQQILRRMNLLR